MKSCHMQHMDGPREYYTQWSDHIEKKMPYDSTYMWNLKKQNIQTEQKQSNRQREHFGGYQREGDLGSGWKRGRD